MIISYKRLNNIFLPSVSLKDPDYSAGLSTAIVKVKDRTAPDYKPTIINKFEILLCNTNNYLLAYFNFMKRIVCCIGRLT